MPPSPITSTSTAGAAHNSGGQQHFITTSSSTSSSLPIQIANSTSSSSMSGINHPMRKFSVDVLPHAPMMLAQSGHSAPAANILFRKRKYRHRSSGGGAGGGGASGGGVGKDSCSSDDGVGDEDEGEEEEEERESGIGPSTKSLSESPCLEEDRRAHHNELERRRRDHIKDHFMALKNSIPLLEGEKSSRALILKRAVDYIHIINAQLKEYKMEMEELKRNHALLSQLQLNNSKHGVGQEQLLSPHHQQGSPFHRQSQQPQPQQKHQPQGLSPLAQHVFAVPSGPSGPSSTNIHLKMDPPMTTLMHTPPPHQQQQKQPSPSSSSSSTTTATPNTNNLTGFLSSLLLQNHPLLTQLRQQQQQQPATNAPPRQQQHVLSSYCPPTTTPFQNTATTTSPAPTGPSSIAEDVHTRLLINSLAIRERQLAAAAMAGESNGGGGGGINADVCVRTTSS